MRNRVTGVLFFMCLLVPCMGFSAARAAPLLTRMVVGCRNFLLIGSLTITPSSQFMVLAQDQLGKTVYLRVNGIRPGHYTGYGAPFSAQPVPGPVHAVIILDGAPLADLTSDYPAESSCTMFNSRGDISFIDGRLNAADPWETAAVYCYSNGTLSIYAPRALDNPAWWEVMRLSQRQLANYPQKPSRNVLISSRAGVQLYRLTSGELQVVAPTKEADKPYTFVWGGC